MSAAIFLAVSCKKSTEIDSFSDTLDVEKKNMSLVIKFTGTGCAPCGSSGYTKFENFKDQYKGSASFLAFRSGVGMPNFRDARTALVDEFGFRTSTPSFSYNLVQDDSKEINVHLNNEVIANSNYTYSVTDDMLNLQTTTKFFKSTTGEYYVIPYVLVDGIIGYQNNHPDSPNTLLSRNVAGVANPTTYIQKKYLGYRLGGNQFNKGYTVNLDFEYQVNPGWDKDQVKVVLVILKKENGDYSFVNSFSK